ncbi:hypothetical protein JOB18_022056 [Solea senegalensis]|uniref:Uncharacterized protein n=1 Tax=Solea senegalensis TaxID=28829 RepID=A0AAV6RTD5_SOLSE|nr:hypothetical protein JOB18_022056 [Solea senegalensis]
MSLRKKQMCCQPETRFFFFPAADLLGLQCSRESILNKGITMVTDVQLAIFANMLAGVESANMTGEMRWESKPPPWKHSPPSILLSKR